MADRISLRGTFRWEHRSPDGAVLSRGRFHNMVTDAAINSLLDTFFNSAAQVSTYYIGLLDAIGFAAIASGDTMSSHTGWTEITSYTPANRPVWGQGAASGQAVTNPVTVDFTFTAIVTTHGMFLATNNTKGGTTGLLWCTAEADSNQLFNIGDVLSVSYTLEAGSD